MTGENVPEAHAVGGGKGPAKFASWRISHSFQFSSWVSGFLVALWNLPKAEACLKKRAINPLIAKQNRAKHSRIPYHPGFCGPSPHLRRGVSCSIAAAVADINLNLQTLTAYYIRKRRKKAKAVEEKEKPAICDFLAREQKTHSLSSRLVFTFTQKREKHF